MLTREEKREWLMTQVSLADYLAEVTGPNCEVLLRDYYDGESEILYILNGEISGRQKGEVISGYMLKKIMREDWRKTDYISNYLLVNEQDRKLMRASTYYLKWQGELCGLLCLNYDMTELMHYRDFVSTHLLYGFEEQKKEATTEFVAQPLDELVDTMVRQVILYWDRNVPLTQLTNPLNPIRQLYELKLFQFKGTVSRVSELLNMSQQSIYRYIKEVEQIVQSQAKHKRRHDLHMTGRKKAAKWQEEQAKERDRTTGALRPTSETRIQHLATKEDAPELLHDSIEAPEDPAKAMVELEEVLSK